MTIKQLEKCPLCGGELESGNLQGNIDLLRQGMYWRSEKDIKRSWWKRNIGFTKWLNAWKFQAQHCPSCEYYFFGYHSRPQLRQADSRELYEKD